MTEQLKLSLWFGAGVLIQAIFLIRNSWNWKKFLGCVGVSLIGMLPGKHETHYSLYSHLLFSFGIFSVMIANTFRKEILPMINEKILLSYSLTFWFAFLSFFYKDTLLRNILVYLFLIPSLGTVFIAFTKSRLNFFWKLFFYSWFISIMIFLGLFEFSYGNISIFFKAKNLYLLKPWDCLLTGMAFLYIVVNATYIVALIPIKEKHQSWQDRMREWHELTGLMTERYSEDQLTYLQALLIIVLQGGFLILNYCYHFLSYNLTINLLILLPMIMLFRGNPNPQPTDTKESVN